MKLSLRFVLPLVVVLIAVAYGVVPLIDRATLRWFIRDLDIRATLLANTIQEPLTQRLASVNQSRLVDFFERISQDERLYAVGYCASPQDRPIASRLFPAEIGCDSLERWDNESRFSPQNGLPSAPLHISVRQITIGAATTPRLILVHDLSFAERRSRETRRYVFSVFLGLAVVVSLITVVVAQLSWRGWVAGMRSLLHGEGLLREPTRLVAASEVRPLADDLRRLIGELEAERRTRDESRITWTPDSLRTILHNELRGDDVLVVSNREPYIHVRDGSSIAVRQPASGLVTALEPVMRACSGVWIAHGSGDADLDVVDRNDHVAVPPGKPDYALRRIWLSDEEESGYYYGLANEGLWPLCHIAHVRPTFRSSDWQRYEAVNRKFARAVAAEAKTKAPIVLVQDYHFALLPRMVREELPKATVITFWHIPWPNPESFAICPWREQIVAGLLGSSILGFHTQYHCHNFLDTVDSCLESHVERETMTVTFGGKRTAVRPYPISIGWPPSPELLAQPVEQCRRDIRAQHRLPDGHAVGVGVDRLDYTKGIVERFAAIERLLDRRPEWQGRFSFIQIAAPTRGGIGEYRAHESRVRAEAERINARFAQGPPPILLKVEHHGPLSIYIHYRAAEVCFVSSLHDGMNLVAKEFVAARDDERGVLILSRFTGAARELPEALLVNPYDAEECATALETALTMPAAEQRDRMLLMRGLVREFNVYRWAGRMLLDAATMRRRGKVLDYGGSSRGEE